MNVEWMLNEYWSQHQHQTIKEEKDIKNVMIYSIYVYVDMDADDDCILAADLVMHDFFTISMKYGADASVIPSMKFKSTIHCGKFLAIPWVEITFIYF